VLSVSKYEKAYVDACRARMEGQLAAYAALISTRSAEKGSDPAFGTAVRSFQPVFFDHMVLVLDDYFLHRSRTTEGKDGNPLNEVRMLCNSILHNGNVFSTDKTIKFKPENSVLKLKFGDEVRLDPGEFRRLFEAYFAEIEKKFL
jgi:hypothetical protein